MQQHEKNLRRVPKPRDRTPQAMVQIQAKPQSVRASSHKTNHLLAQRKSNGTRRTYPKIKARTRIETPPRIKAPPRAEGTEVAKATKDVVVAKAIRGEEAEVEEVVTPQEEEGAK